MIIVEFRNAIVPKPEYLWGEENSSRIGMEKFAFVYRIGRLRRRAFVLRFVPLRGLVVRHFVRVVYHFTAGTSTFAILQDGAENCHRRRRPHRSISLAV